MFNLILLSSIPSTASNKISVPFYENDRQDLFLHLGTAFTGVGSYTNPTGSYVQITTTEGSLASGFNQLSALSDRDSNSKIRINSVPTTIQIEFSNDFKIDLSAYSIKTSSTASAGGHPKSWSVSASNDGVTWTNLQSVLNKTLNADDTFYDYYCPSRFGFFKYLAFRFTALGTTYADINELRLYGGLQNLVTGVAGYKIFEESIASYLDVDLKSQAGSKVIKYNGATGYWESDNRYPWVLDRRVLTGTFTISSAYKPVFYLLSPNGANRDVILPASPVLNDTIRIKNLDGAYSLNVKETVGGPVVFTLSNTALKLQYELYYDGTSWQAIG